MNTPSTLSPIPPPVFGCVSMPNTPVYCPLNLNPEYLLLMRRNSKPDEQSEKLQLKIQKMKRVINQKKSAIRRMQNEIEDLCDEVHYWKSNCQRNLTCDRILARQKIKEQVADFKCGVCWEKNDSSKAILSNCGHMFHEDCLLEWLGNRNYNHCPYCREKYDINDIINVNDY